MSSFASRKASALSAFSSSPYTCGEQKDASPIGAIDKPIREVSYRSDASLTLIATASTAQNYLTRKPITALSHSKLSPLLFHTLNLFRSYCRILFSHRYKRKHERKGFRYLAFIFSWTCRIEKVLKSSTFTRKYRPRTFHRSPPHILFKYLRREIIIKNSFSIWIPGIRYSPQLRFKQDYVSY